MLRQPRDDVTPAVEDPMTDAVFDKPTDTGILVAIMRPPFVGLITVVAMLMVIALGHSVMVLMERIFGEEHRYGAALWFGAFGVALLWIGVRSHKEALGSWLGFFAGRNRSRRSSSNTCTDSP